MTERDLAALREVNVSMGIMLESVVRAAARARRRPRSRARQGARRGGSRPSRCAGKLGIPFTTGILIGIGETHAERVDSLLAIRDLHERYGHIQEVIVQNFRAKPTDPDARLARARRADDLLRTVAVARLLLGPTMNIQAPPNLSADGYDRLAAAGLNDWGGISPLTPDHINPERPWPGSGRAAAPHRGRRPRAARAARRLSRVHRPAPRSSTSGCARGCAALVDDRGPRAEPDLEIWRHW